MSGSAFSALVDLEPSDDGATQVGSPAPERVGRTFGGQFLAQALVAGARAVEPERRAHSLHAYFLKAGDVDAPTTYHVTPIRSGRSFALVEVVARQVDEVFRMLVSFHTPEVGLEYQPGGAYPTGQVPAPEVAPIDYPGFAAQHPDFDPAGWDGAERPMAIRYVNPPAPDETDPCTEPQLMWMRITDDPLADDPVLHQAGLAYLADSTLVDNVLLPHGYRWQDARLTGASLDHAMWFHRPVRVDQWLLYDQRVEATGGGRGLATGRFFTTDGALVATCTQEGLIRWSS